MKNNIIAIVGMCGAGKSVASDILENKGYKKVYFGGVTMEKLKEEGLEINPENERMMRERLRKEFNWDEKQALQRIQESDANRAGYHSSFYNADINDPVNYHAVLNTGLLNLEDAASAIANLVKQKVTEKEEKEGNKIIEDLLKAQTVVNKLSMERKLNIEFMHASIQGNIIVLHGVSDSPVVVEQALQIIREEMPGYDAKSAVSIIHDFKTFQ